MGTSVSLSGSTLVVGAPNANLGTGAAYVFLLGGTWALDDTIIPLTLDALDEFGASVATTPDVFFVGAPFDDDTASAAGAVYVFEALLELGDLCNDGLDCQSGICSDGVCCDRQCSCGACSLPAGAAVAGTCNAFSAGTICRVSAGVCDLAETCDGSSFECPADDKQPSGVLCRAAAGVCDETQIAVLVGHALLAAQFFVQGEGFAVEILRRVQVAACLDDEAQIAQRDGKDDWIVERVRERFDAPVRNFGLVELAKTTAELPKAVPPLRVVRVQGCGAFVGVHGLVRVVQEGQRADLFRHVGGAAVVVRPLGGFRRFHLRENRLGRRCIAPLDMGEGVGNAVRCCDAFLLQVLQLFQRPLDGSFSAFSCSILACNPAKAVSNSALSVSDRSSRSLVRPSSMLESA